MKKKNENISRENRVNQFATAIYRYLDGPFQLFYLPHAGLAAFRFKSSHQLILNQSWTKAPRHTFLIAFNDLKLYFACYLQYQPSKYPDFQAIYASISNISSSA